MMNKDYFERLHMPHPHPMYNKIELYYAAYRSEGAWTQFIRLFEVVVGLSAIAALWFTVWALQETIRQTADQLAQGELAQTQAALNTEAINEQRIATAFQILSLQHSKVGKQFAFELLAETGQNLSGVDLSCTTCEVPPYFRNVRLGAELDVMGAPADLRKVQPINNLIVSGTDMSYLNVTNTNLDFFVAYDTNLTDATFFNSSVFNSNFARANLKFAQFRSLNTGYHRIEQHNVDTLLLHLDFREADLSHALFSNVKISGFDLSRADLTGMNLTRIVAASGTEFGRYGRDTRNLPDLNISGARLCDNLQPDADPLAQRCFLDLFGNTMSGPGPATPRSIYARLWYDSRWPPVGLKAFEKAHEITVQSCKVQDWGRDGPQYRSENCRTIISSNTYGFELLNYRHYRSNPTGLGTGIDAE